MGRCFGVERGQLGLPKEFRRRDWMGSDRADTEFEKKVEGETEKAMKVEERFPVEKC